MDENQNTYPTVEELQALSVEDLTAAQERARSEAAELLAVDPEQITDAQLSRLEEVGAFIDSIENAETGELARRDAAVADRASRLEAQRNALNPPEADDAADSETGDAAPEGDAAPVDIAPEGDAAPVDGNDAAAPTAMAASGGRPVQPSSTVRRMRQPANPTPAAPEESGLMAIVASADIHVPGASTINSGTDLGAVAGATPGFLARLGQFPKVAQKGAYDRKPVATIHRRFANDRDGLHQDNKDFRDDLAMLREAGNERRLNDKSLVASGGWCAPSENLYGMCADETLDGTVDLPTTGITRGGINYTPGPDFQDIYTDAGFAQTEAEAIAGDAKTCQEVDCPDFTEVRLDAVGICVKSPLLTKAAYPELVERFLEGTVIANQHKVNARLIAAMRTALGTAWAPTLTGTPVFWSTLTTVEWVIETQRQAYRLSESESLEVIAPRWLRVQLRADLANRNGMVASERVTNAMISDHFADRGAAVQFVLGYQEIASPTGTAFITIPATVELMVYKAGTFVKGTADVISLDAVYDAASLETNMFTAAFVEDGVLLAKMCHGGKRITVPTGASGMLGSPQLDDVFGGAQVENAGAAAA